MDELSSIWSELSDIQQADITRLVAGLRQAQGFSALMVNFDDARKSMELFETASGDALEKFEKRMDSIQHKSMQLKASIQEVFVDLIDVSVFKTLIDGVNNLVKALGKGDAAILKILAIPTAFAVLPSIIRIISQTGIGRLINNIPTIIGKPKSKASNILFKLPHIS